ncbi:MAG: toprim domain-containing protein [Anaplasmataceae bacterium]|nr:toprim domain-containing protein [Anaplasmataceae bacterium]
MPPYPYLPESIRRLAETLSNLPSLGPRQALRLAFYIAQRDPEGLRRLSQDLTTLSQLKTCQQCFFVHEDKNQILCPICRDPQRNKSQIAFIEKETELLALEQTGRYQGRYLLLGTLEKHGMFDDLQKLRLQSLKTFIQKELGGKAEEVVIALSPTRYGDHYAEIIQKEFSPLAQKVTRLGRGLPRGGEIEFADDETLGASLESRG